MNMGDIKKQAEWEIELERFEKAVEREKERILKKKQLFPWRIKLVNLNEEDK